LTLKANQIGYGPARARARIQAERLDEAALQSLAAWLRYVATMYPPRRRKRLEAEAAFIEGHNQRVEARALDHRWGDAKTGS
jgi:hypothetical protein